MTGEERLRPLLDSLVGVAVLALDVRGFVLEHNTAADELFGRVGEELRGQHFSSVYPATAAGAEQARSALLEAAGSGRHEQVLRLRRGTDAHFVGEVTITSLDVPTGPSSGFAHVTRDVTEKREFERLLAHQALHDPLTGLPNRALFLDRVRHALLRATRTGRSPVVVFIDLDGFKGVNDSLGHKAGDELLVIAAARLESAVRPGDTICRLGGDEFVALCEGLEDPAAAIGVAERIVAAVGAASRIREHEIVVQASAGIAVGRRSDMSPEELLGNADTAMYRAKRRGRGQVALFQPTMRPRALERLTAEGDIRQAVAQGRLRVYYQVVADLRTGEAAGVEALARLVGKEGGLVAAGQFIPLAEETGLILPLGAEVLRTACLQASRWHTKADGSAPLTLVNLSARQVDDPGFPAFVERTLDETGVDPGSLCLEITERTLVSDAPSTARSLRAVRDLGVRLAIDDFGVGHSSLLYLQRFSVDVLKIDASFIEGLGRDDSAAALVKAILGMADALGLLVIAEGVEHPRQLDVLRDLECPLVQGYGLQCPQSAHAAERSLRRLQRSDELLVSAHREGRS